MVLKCEKPRRANPVVAAMPSRSILPSFARGRYPVLTMSLPLGLESLPKAEVHVHLTSTMRPATLEELSAREGLNVPTSFNSLQGYLEVIRLAGETLRSPDDYWRLVREYCEDAARQGVRYAELELSTIKRPYDCLAAAIDAASRQRDVEIRFIVSVRRSDPVDNAWAALEQATEAAQAGHVVAVGVSGQEAGFPPEPFAQIFAEAKQRGLRSAPHAGEAAGPESVRGALEALGAERIQHGVRVVEDPAVIRKLLERGVPLAVCLTSNLRLGIVPSLESHPIIQLWEAGVSVSVNTDMPGLLGCDLVGEYRIAGRLLRLDRNGFARLALNSVESSFAPDALKAQLRTAISEWDSKG